MYKPMPPLDKVRAYIQYDKLTGAFTWKIDRGGKAKKGTRAGSQRADGYYSICLDGKSFPAARIAWYLETESDPGEKFIDHINGNPLDNRFANLRLAMHSENCRNRKMRSDNKSGYKGVYKMGNKWAAQIGMNGQSVFLGTFNLKEQAAEAYSKAALEYHGNFARITAQLITNVT